MFNWSLELRKQTEFISPKGPSFDWAPWYNLNIQGTHIKIKVPNHKSVVSAEGDDTTTVPDLKTIYSKRYDKNGISLHFYELIYRNWSFYGPWFTGSMGLIKMQASILSPVNIPEGLNYFHPRALEASIVDALTHAYGHLFSVDGKQQEWLAPMNWQPLKKFPCIAARFDVINNLSAKKGPDYFFVMPLSKHHYLNITFDISRAGVFTDKVPKPTVDEWIDREPFIKLVNQVLDSVQVTLSPQARADQEEALQGLDDKSLVEEFLPIKWTKE